MNKSRIVKFLVVMLGGLLLVAAGILYLLYFVNVSIVFYQPGQVIAIAPNQPAEERLALVADRPVKNVILLIGDGMGLSHVAATRIHYAGPDGRLQMERMPVTGLMTTHAIGDLITDSAASATALSTGVKTRNGRIGVDSSGVAHPTIMEVARDAGYATGLVTSTELTDATPAAFAAHVPRRKQQSEIALQMLRAKINVLLGQGAHFRPRQDSRSKRKDAIDPIALARELGYTVVDSKTALAEVDAGYVLGIFHGILADRMAPEIQPRPDTPTLPELTQKAIDLLKENERGFFLLIEEEGSDKGSHVNRVDYFLHYLKQFDEAVGVALDFARREGQTLVIVTADHETGGMNLVEGGYRNRSEAFTRKKVELTWDSDGHTGQPVPLFAYGPHAIRFTGVWDNTDIPKILAELLGLERFAGHNSRSSEE